MHKKRNKDPNLTMIFCQWLIGFDNLMKICIHKLINNIYIVEFVPVWRLDDVSYGNNLHHDKHVLQQIFTLSFSNDESIYLTLNNYCRFCDGLMM